MNQWWFRLRARNSRQKRAISNLVEVLDQLKQFWSYLQDRLALHRQSCDKAPWRMAWTMSGTNMQRAQFWS